MRKRAGISFDGFTWEERFLVLTTPFDFEAERGYCPRSYFADPEEWCNCFKVSANGPPGLWRTVYPTDPKIPEAELMSEAAVQALEQRRADRLLEPRDADRHLRLHGVEDVGRTAESA